MTKQQRYDHYIALSKFYAEAAEAMLPGLDARRPALVEVGWHTLHDGTVIRIDVVDRRVPLAMRGK